MSADEPMNTEEYIQNAVRAVNQKKPVPEIDFTLHTMEDGSQVSTLDRVCKGTTRFPRCATIAYSPPRLPHVRAGILADSSRKQTFKPPPSPLPPPSNSGRPTTPANPTSTSSSNISTAKAA